ncbi:MAG: oligosaccharide flippase family protein [bacterium]
MLAKTARFVLGLASSIIVVRALGDYDYGVLSLVRAVLAFVMIIAGFGLGQSLLKFLPVFKVANDRRAARALVRRVVFIQFLVWAVLLAVCYLFADRFESVFEFAGVGAFLWIAVALGLFELTLRLVTQVLQAYYDTKLLSIANVVSHVVFIAGLLVLLPGGLGIVGVLAAAALGNAVGTLMVVRRTVGYFRITDGTSRSSGVDRARILRFSLPFAVIGVLNIIVWRQSEVLFLAHFRGAEETGFFDLAYRLPQTLLEFVPGTVWPIIMAGFSEVYAKDAKDLNKAIDKYYKMLFILCAPLCVMGMVLGGKIVPILFSETMAPAAIPTQIFFAIFTVSFFGTPLSMSLYALRVGYANTLRIHRQVFCRVEPDATAAARDGIHWRCDRAGGRSASGWRDGVVWI